MSQRYIRELCVGHCYAWIWTSVYNSHGGLSLYLHASANLDTYILNLHAQSRATVCTLHGNMYSSSMCAQFHGTFKYCYFFEQVFSTKMTINLAFWEFNDENECKLKPATRATDNLEPQFVPSMGICTVQVYIYIYMCVHSWCSFHGTFKYCYFFKQMCSLKWP